MVAIGNGTALMAQDFIETFGVRFEVFTDPSRKSYQLAGMQRKLGIGLRTIGRSIRAMRAGFRQGKTQGDPWQQGGVLGIAPADDAAAARAEIWYEHVDDGAGDNVEPQTVLLALRAYQTARAATTGSAAASGRAPAAAG